MREAIGEEARRTRIAAFFLPILGPLPADTDYVSNDTLDEGTNAPLRLAVQDRETKPLMTLEIKVYLRSEQVVDTPS